MSPSATYRYYNCCVSWPREDVEAEGGLCDMISDHEEIDRADFVAAVNREDLAQLEEDLGYATRPGPGLRMKDDYHVSYARSRLHGKTVFYVAHSAIEYVFTETGEG